MLSIRLFTRLLERIADELGVSSSELEVVHIDTVFNHGTAQRTFYVFIQLPDGEQVVKTIEETPW